jgi:hypothetical protein
VELIRARINWLALELIGFAWLALELIGSRLVRFLHRYKSDSSKSRRVFWTRFLRGRPPPRAVGWGRAWCDHLMNSTSPGLHLTWSPPHLDRSPPHLVSTSPGLHLTWSPPHLVSTSPGLHLTWSPPRLVSTSPGLHLTWSPPRLVSTSPGQKSLINRSRGFHRN